MYKNFSVYNDEINILELIKDCFDIVFKTLLFSVCFLVLFYIIFGYKPFLVIGDSMYPIMRKDKDIIIVKNVHYDDLKVGDIITFEFGNIYNTHRIVEISADGIKTKGDNNSVEDAGFVSFEDVIGRVDAIYSGLGQLYLDIRHYILEVGVGIIGIFVLVQIIENESHYDKYQVLRLEEIA